MGPGVAEFEINLLQECKKQREEMQTQLSEQVCLSTLDQMVFVDDESFVNGVEGPEDKSGDDVETGAGAETEVVEATEDTVHSVPNARNPGYYCVG